ncbi:MAG: hypothetical protein M0Z81_07740 [Deltaproteobacteria bacterium]|jgi:hypothetical protein|nr:hypothetical protein [Deltaproteobacteria bacterium]
MKQYVIDQLREADYDKILGFLQKNADASEFGDVFWVRLPADLYTDVQKEHEKCRPFCFAVNLSPKQAAFEMLVRSRQVLRCSCIAYADARQRDYIIDYADRMLDELKIKI